MPKRLTLKNAGRAAEELAGVERAIAVLTDYRDSLRQAMGTAAPPQPDRPSKVARPATARRIAEAAGEKAADKAATVKEAGVRTAKERPSKAEVKKASKILARRRLNSLLTS